MLVLKQLLLGLFFPALVSGGVLIFARSLSSKQNAINTEKKSWNWLIAVALSGGYIVGYLGLEGLPPFPPRLGIHWLCYLAIVGIITGCFWHLAGSGRLIVQIVLSIAIPRLLLNSTFKHTWGQLEGIIWWICLAIGVFICWNLVQRSFTTLPRGASGPFVYFGLFGGTALVLAPSGSLRLAQHAGVLVAVFAAVWVITFVLQHDSERFVIPPGASPVVALLLAGIWMNGYFFEEVPTVSAILLVISLCLVPIGRIAAIQNLGARRSMLVQIAAIALPVVIAIGIAVARSGLFGDSGGY